MAGLWRRRKRLEAARTWKLAFMWAASTADHLAEETARAALELEQLQGAGQVASESLAEAEERYRQLVLKWEEMQAIERALERQVLRGWRGTDGLSPRVRGNPDCALHLVADLGSIPACTGEPLLPYPPHCSR